MKVLILSDIHDHVEKLQQVIEQVTGQVERVIFCGDMCSPFTARLLAQLKLPTYACLGNNDEDQIGLTKQAGDLFDWTFLAQEYGQIQLDGKKIAFCHYPKLGQLLAQTGEFDAVFHGHTHQPYQRKVAECLLLNPGAVCGIQQGQPGQASYAVYDSASHTAEIVYLD